MRSLFDVRVLPAPFAFAVGLLALGCGEGTLTGVSADGSGIPDWRGPGVSEGTPSIVFPDTAGGRTIPGDQDSAGGEGGTCVLDCADRECGDDGCGGLCGTCALGEVCEEGFCGGVGTCEADCKTKECGDDGCGGLCGGCAVDEICTDDGLCIPFEEGEEGGTCLPDCAGKECGPNGCGGLCGNCVAGDDCTAGGLCAGNCVSECAGKQCGPDGCGAECGSCDADETCTDGGLCVANCTGSCIGKACGPDGCGESCGTCGAGQSCNNSGQCEPDCVASCAGKGCGTDGCGGSCGNCPAGTECQGGQCVCVPNCSGIECGSNGCGGSCGGCSSGEECTGGQCVFDVGTMTIYRFYYALNGDDDHMFSTSQSGGGAGYTLDGISFHLFVSDGPGLIPLYQSYCPSCTDHFQTVNNGEGAPEYGSQAVLGFCAQNPIAQASTPLARLYREDVSNHFVTANAVEAANAEAAFGYVIESDAICYVP